MNKFFEKKPEQSGPMVIDLKRSEKTETVSPPTRVEKKIEEAVKPIESAAEIKRAKKKVSPLLIAVLSALILGVGGGFVVFLFTTKTPAIEAKKTISVPHPAPVSTTTAVAEIVKRVGKLMVLPVGEEPTVAMVSDVNTLKDQGFFKKAKNGDFVLMYQKSRRAVLYDALGDKILEVGPIVDTATSTP